MGRYAGVKLPSKDQRVRRISCQGSYASSGIHGSIFNGTSLISSLRTTRASLKRKETKTSMFSSIVINLPWSKNSEIQATPNLQFHFSPVIFLFYLILQFQCLRSINLLKIIASNKIPLAEIFGPNSSNKNTLSSSKRALLP